MRTVISGLLFTVLLAACVSSQPKTEPEPAIDKDAHLKVEDWRELMPAGATVVVGLSVTRLVASPVANRLYQIAEGGAQSELATLRQTAKDCGVDLANDLHTVVMGMYQGEPEAAVALVVRGQFTEEVIAGCLTKIAQRDGTAVQSSELAGYQVYKSAEANNDALVSVPVPNLMLVASTRPLMESALTADMPRLGGEASELGGYIDSLPPNRAVWGAGIIPPESEVAKSIQQPLGGVVSQAPKAVYGWADAHDSVELHTNVLMSSPEDATQLLGWVNKMLAQVRPVIAAQGLGPLLDQLKLGTDKNRLTADFTPTVEDIDTLLKMVSAGY